MRRFGSLININLFDIDNMGEKEAVMRFRR